MNEMLEILFMNFLESAHTGPLADAMAQISGEIDNQIADGAVDADLVGDYECACLRYGFTAGFNAALKLLNVQLAA